MAELPEDDSRMVEYAKQLHAIIVRYVGSHPISRQSMKVLQEIMTKYQIDFKKRFGADFPDLAVLVFPRLNAIEIMRADLDEAAVQQVIVNLTVKFPNITAFEIATSIQNAFPRYVANNIDPSYRRLSAKSLASVDIPGKPN